MKKFTNKVKKQTPDDSTTVVLSGKSKRLVSKDSVTAVVRDSASGQFGDVNVMTLEKKIKASDVLDLNNLLQPVSAKRVAQIMTKVYGSKLRERLS